MIKLISTIAESFLSVTFMGACCADNAQDTQITGKRNNLLGNIQEKYRIEQDK